MCNKVWYICENLPGSMEMLERKRTLFSMFSRIGLLCCRLEDFIFQANRVAGFSGLNLFFLSYLKDAFTPNVKSVLTENLGGILSGTQC